MERNVLSAFGGLPQINAAATANVPSFAVVDVDSDDGMVGSDDSPPELVNEPKSKTCANFPVNEEFEEEEVGGHGRAKSLSLGGGLLASLSHQQSQAADAPQPSNSFSAQPASRSANLGRPMASSLRVSSPQNANNSGRLYEKTVARTMAASYTQAANPNTSSSSITSRGSATRVSPTGQQAMWDRVVTFSDGNGTQNGMRQNAASPVQPQVAAAFESLTNSGRLFEMAQQQQQQQQQQLLALQAQAVAQHVQAQAAQAQVQAQVQAQAQAQAQAHAQRTMAQAHINAAHPNCSSSSILSQHSMSSAAQSPRTVVISTASNPAHSGNLQRFVETDGRQSGYNSAVEGVNASGHFTEYAMQTSAASSPSGQHPQQMMSLGLVAGGGIPAGQQAASDDSDDDDDDARGNASLNNKRNKERLMEKLGDDMDKWDFGTRPCDHNSWDDVRSRNGVKVLRCRECQKQFKLPSYKVPRCLQFLQEGLCHRTNCHLLHVHKKKKPISERHGDFGIEVLKGVPMHPVAAQPTEQQPTTKRTLLPDDCSSEQRLLGIKEEMRVRISQYQELAQLVVVCEKELAVSPSICVDCKFQKSLTPYCGKTGLTHEGHPAPK
eukprot:TRINITY_DN3000_c0_g2_i1.p1 TRINITY_DN3000_c0_g2~~TRINITY_DN3000_c0_g2_i1.p1  ORF type:complete len:607 (+),score=180.82 TRINITY_DN3000_c0_g2_i1:201-2021(+)